jgi:hypothetical protein
MPLNNNQYAKLTSCSRCRVYEFPCETGLVLIAYGATEINPIGLLILLCSVTVGGLNQVIVQSQLQRDGAKYLKLPTAKASSGPASTAGERAEGERAPQLKLNPIVFTYAANRAVATKSLSSVHRNTSIPLALASKILSQLAFGCGMMGALAVGR